MRSCISICWLLVVFLTMKPLVANDVNTGGQKGIQRVLSSYTMGKGAINAGGSFRLATEMEYSKGPDGIGAVKSIGSGNRLTKVSRDNPFVMTGDVYCAYGLFSFFDAAINLPVYSDITGWGEKTSGIGDLEMSVKMANPYQKEETFFIQSYYFNVIFPTGVSDKGFFPRHSYYLEDTMGNYTFTSDAFFFNPALVWTFDFEKFSDNVPLQLHINFGGVLAEKKRNSSLIAAIGIEYTPQSLITLFAEIAGESRVKYYNKVFDIKTINNDQLWISPGVKFNLPAGFYAMLAGDIGISDDNADLYVNWKKGKYVYSTKATPAYGFNVSFGWNGELIKQDSDGDGIPNKKDKCPEDAEDIDDFQDEDGCPDLDNDGDRVADALDKCPGKAEDIDGFEDEDGCLDLDNDGDGIADSLDKCPQEAEDKDGFEDEDGCPDLDNDGDGIPDEKDTCPKDAEDLDGFEDADGCPDMDNDGDGVSDAQDKCPGVSGLPENNGCPKTKEITRGKLVLSGVTFQPGKAILNSNSYTILDQVYESLSEWKEVKLEIQGHTDNKGNDKVNLKLSQERADAVRLYLIRKGVDSGRLRAVGYGEEFPVADNHTAEGRERNRRVEMRRID